jgi:hypothetical protein
MIAFTIALTWMTLTAGGFAALTALGQIETRNDGERERASHARDVLVSADTPLGPDTLLGPDAPLGVRSAAVPVARAR